MAVTERLWRVRARSIPLGRKTVLMGVLNVTPDSFSDGGLYADPEAAVRQAWQMVADGADLLDVGGESTRPGSARLEAQDELARVLPVLERLAGQIEVPVSIDTYKAIVAERALRAGAEIVNDVWGFQHDPDIARVAADSGAGAVLMHNRHEADGTIDIMEDIRIFLSRSIDIALAAGLSEAQIVVDPGVGFGKTWQQSVEVIAKLDRIRQLGFPVLLGASRKSVIGRLLGIETPSERLQGSVAAHLAGVARGADIIRAHDITAHRQALQVFDAIRNYA